MDRRQRLLPQHAQNLPPPAARPVVEQQLDKILDQRLTV
jgi:hypothetical protein